MSTSRARRYRRGLEPMPDSHAAWPLSGAGLDQLGHDGQPMMRPMLAPGPYELLVRNDAVGLYLSDVKVIQMRTEHPGLKGCDLAACPSWRCPIP